MSKLQGGHVPQCPIAGDANAFIIRHVRYAIRLNPLKCAYFDRMLSKYAKLISLKNLALNKRTCGPDLP